MRELLITLALILQLTTATAQSIDLAFCIAAPTKKDVPRFVKFIDEELGPNGIKTLILRVDFNYKYESYPNLRDDNPLTKSDIKKLVAVSRKHGINLIPQINLLGHQSWAETTYALLTEYPEFDETPNVKMPEKYEWPNDDGLYCRSYCPLHPEVHKVVFSLVDEIVEVFEATDFHAGMDEVFYIGHEQCPRCAGKDKAELFANEVNKISDHFASDSVKLWIWGDRLLDKEETQLSIWDASDNGTAKAIDLINKNVMINDWHYNVTVPTPAYFVTKGFSVYACFWNVPQVAKDQLTMMNTLRKLSSPVLKPQITGGMQTIWVPAGLFLDAYYGESDNDGALKQVASFNAMLEWIDEND
ncbi:family 20 glycosylhydrolase [Marinoscillum pacificum]|uniref:family 20 glycosylhydrolase n=1 Tax=Marinoscillum pacificum TaxID=392723 RepID=UPI002158026E|nr:family 20 glycosylhydrolase [Marinoscillum pacificum]